jgi:hypothetical protein
MVNNYVASSEGLDWGEEDTDLELTATDTQNALDTIISADDDALLDTPDEEQDLGAPLSQHQPSLQWEEDDLIVALF